MNSYGEYINELHPILEYDVYLKLREIVDTLELENERLKREVKDVTDKNSGIIEAKRTCEFCKYNMQKGCYNNGVNTPQCRRMALYLTANDYCSKFERDE